MALSDVKCRNARPGEKLKKLSDGGGLQLWIQPTGARLWRLAYRFGGKQKLLALGSYPLVSLAEARKARDEAKRQLAAGIDPVQEKRLGKAGPATDSFRSIAEEYVDKLKKEGRADATITKVNWLLDFTYPIIGDQPVRQIDPRRSSRCYGVWKLAVDMNRPAGYARPSAASSGTQSQQHVPTQIPLQP